MSREETFAHDLAADDALETELVRLVTRLGAELRADGLEARGITVKLRDHDFRTRQASRTLDEPVSTDRAVLAVARELLASLRRRRRVPARLLGVALSRFDAAGAGAQLELLERAERGGESARDRAVSQAVDQVNRRFGRRALEPARLKRGRERP